MTSLDQNVAVAILNLITLAGNVFWTLKFKSVQGNDTLLHTVTDQLDAKNLLLDASIKELAQLRLQYDHLQRQLVHLKAENDTYRRFHEHDLSKQSN